LPKVYGTVIFIVLLYMGVKFGLSHCAEGRRLGVLENAILREEETNWKILVWMG